MSVCVDSRRNVLMFFFQEATIVQQSGKPHCTLCILPKLSGFTKIATAAR